MAVFCCFSSLVGRKIKKEVKKPVKASFDLNKGSQVSLEKYPLKALDAYELKSAYFIVPASFFLHESSRCEVKEMSHEDPLENDVKEDTSKGRDEQHENPLFKSDCSTPDHQGYVGMPSNEHGLSVSRYVEACSSFRSEISDQSGNVSDQSGNVSDQSGNVSDPGIRKQEFCASPKLKRSCSNLETIKMLTEHSTHTPPSKTKSFENLQRLAEQFKARNSGRPLSVRSYCSADEVILKKHFSSQILPSGSGRLWWKLLLWSHKNFHEPFNTRNKLQNKPSIIYQGGYSSDTLEPNRGMGVSTSESSSSFDEESSHKNESPSRDGVKEITGFQLQNQWVALPSEPLSPLTRVDEWVREVLATSLDPIEDEDHEKNEPSYPLSPDNGNSSARNTSHLVCNYNVNLPVEIAHANSVIKSLNTSSTIAHISGVGLKVIPSFSRFTTLRSLHLSGNLIVHISPGSLPKGLHTLDLSKNKISIIEGLRDITRLRVLNLSYNRISRIGQGLSNCTLIKELYLTGNKISIVEGLHRLLKLTILDLSFNKITTSKALGQVVANYNSLLALNLLGNPIQSNIISNDKLRKTLCSLLPKLVYLNKQPINPQKARAVAIEAISRAALGNSSRHSCRKSVKRVGHSGSSSSGSHRSNASVSHKSKHKLRSRAQHQYPLEVKSSALVSSNH